MVNPSGGIVRARADPEAMALNPIDGAVRARTELWSGGLGPPKRRLVKKMMFEKIVQAIVASWFHFNSKNKLNLSAAEAGAAATQIESSRLLNKQFSI
ncbi:hypothetical protein Acr_21g0004580 [Actinidia rufa]|uniref:Uncharacterized protein n=1 Tax=Actinidia rufa TaxID=165716 RepID=A0A7J0GGC6_9ERIC|nr:hypothetical protein Acr_21g0004580 [Actinidia rufa]